ncbi:cell division FtsZ family protein [Pontibacter sp. HSC-14F20]|uniref:cell division protein FtsZ n=1 Tax=Pontibacter sp. HSC-14F20 TaxID=2864136 RepID=UPI001C739678|nr:cell division protein FtsZ [Pontibacter sp. HSC-14F20]MBX0333017.1 cell division FtsZ family protein [Pontibacter sp. HSC-14F20]
MKTYNRTTVKVIGVGGSGCNTLNYIGQQQLRQVHLVACDFHKPDLENSTMEDRFYLERSEVGVSHGTGDPEIGRKAALKRADAINTMLLEGSPEIVFIVAGMGGGAGTGAAPEIARLAKELGILTIGVVTAPGHSEGDRKAAVAEAGIAAMRQHTDTTVVLANDKVRQLYGELPRADVFVKLDEYVAHAVRAIAEIVAVTAELNVDVDDVRTVMAGARRATVGSGTGAGQGRAMLAAQQAVATALLGSELQGSDRVLLSIISGPETELEMDELTEITEFIQNSTSEQVEVIFGHAIDDDLGDQLRVTFIASSFSEN